MGKVKAGVTVGPATAVGEATTLGEIARKGGFKKCIHPGRYHLGSDGLTIVSPHPQADSEFAREQGYVVAKIEPAYRSLAAKFVAAMNAAVEGRCLGCVIEAKKETST